MPFCRYDAGRTAAKKNRTYFPRPELFGRKFQIPDNRVNIVLFREGTACYFMGIKITVGDTS